MSESNARKLPVWAMGLANCPTGFVYGFISTAFGILLASRGVSVAKIGTISAIGFSPTFWAWLVSPVLDVRFTKRTYAFALAAMAAVLLGVTILSIGNLTLFTVTLTASCACAVLYSNSVQGWAPDIVDDAEYDAMAGWFNIANLGAAGLFGALTIVFVRVLPLPVAAVVLAAMVFAPAMLLLYFPAARKPEGTLRANFGSMTKDMRRVLREGRVWIGLLIFLSPVGFALTNLFSSMGADFKTSERVVTTLNGPLVAVACSLGCLLAIPLCKVWKRRTVYLIAGVGSAVAAVAMALLPHTVAIYAAGLLFYNFTQGFNYASFTALELEIIGPQNAVCGTLMAMLSASANVPISTMTYVDSHVHDAFGLKAMLFTDAAASTVTAVVLLVVALPLLDKVLRRQRVAPIE